MPTNSGTRHADAMMAERDQEPVQQEEDALSEASIAVAGQEHRVRRPRAQDNVQPAAPDQAEGQQPAGGTSPISLFASLTNPLQQHEPAKVLLVVYVVLVEF